MSVAQQCEGLLQRGEDQLCVVSGEAERRLNLEHVVLQTVIHDHDPVLLHQPDTYTHMIVQTYTHMHVLYIQVQKMRKLILSSLMCTTNILKTGCPCRNYTFVCLGYGRVGY